MAINARTLELLNEEHHHQADCTVLNNQRVTPVRAAGSKAADTASDDATDAGMGNDVLVENGRIVLQYRNVNAAGVRRTENSSANRAHFLQDTVVDRTDMGHVVIAPVRSTALTEQEYDMNDVVWKNMGGSSITKY